MNRLSRKWTLVFFILFVLSMLTFPGFPVVWRGWPVNLVAAIVISLSYAVVHHFFIRDQLDRKE